MTSKKEDHLRQPYIIGGEPLRIMIFPKAKEAIKFGTEYNVSADVCVIKNGNIGKFNQLETVWTKENKG